MNVKMKTEYSGGKVGVFYADTVDMLEAAKRQGVYGNVHDIVSSYPEAKIDEQTITLAEKFKEILADAEEAIYEKGLLISASIQLNAFSLHYRKFDGKWGLFLEQGDGRLRDACNSSIATRLECIQALPQLIQALYEAHDNFKTQSASAIAGAQEFLKKFRGCGDEEARAFIQGWNAI